MRSTTQMRLIAAVLLSTPLAGCVHTGIYNDVPRCEDLVPPAMRARVAPADLPSPEQWPDGHQKAEPWMSGFVGQTGQLDKANDRGDGIDHIYRTCLDQHRAALKKAQRKIL